MYYAEEFALHKTLGLATYVHVSLMSRKGSYYK